MDVKALYPSVKFDKLTLALKDCLKSCTNWSDTVINTILELIIYTLENQQIRWNSNYWILNQGIPTGGKHSVPLANIFLTYILRYSLKTQIEFRNDFCGNIISSTITAPHKCDRIFQPLFGG